MDESLFLFIDIEASGLHATSYPIEVGWSGLDLRAESFLINPHISWSPDDWSYQSEDVHKITQADLDLKGISVIEAFERLDDAWKERFIFSDAPDLDSFWLRRLYEAAGATPRWPVPLLNGWQLVKDALQARGLPTDMATLEEYERAVDVKYPRPHRAGPDAVHLAALYRAAKGHDL